MVDLDQDRPVKFEDEERVGADSTPDYESVVTTSWRSAFVVRVGYR